MYSTVEAVRDALTPGGLSGDRTTAAIMTDTDIQDQIEEADSIIDIALSNRYVTPIAPADLPDGSPVAFWSRSIAAYLATLTKRKGADLKETDPIVRRYNLTMGQIAQIQGGKAQLQITLLPDADIQDAVQVVNQYEGDMFAPGDYSLRHEQRGLFDNEGVWPSGYLR